MFNFFKILLFLFFGFFYNYFLVAFAEEKMKIGLLVPITGDNKNLGQQIIKSTRIALRDVYKRY